MRITGSCKTDRIERIGKEMMNREREFFYDEVREGFYIPGIMKRAWGAGLTILSEIDRICKKYEIPYYADGEIGRAHV